MLVKLLITFVSIFLLIDEYFKVLDKVEKSKRKIILLISLVLLSIVSIIDVVTEVNEGKELVEKANKIIDQSDTLITQTNSIIVDLGKNIESVRNSNKSIIAIDSVLKGVRDTVSNQVEIIKSTARKSAELIKLEEKKFKADEAKLNIYTTEIRLSNNTTDSTFFNLEYDFRNLGKRRIVNMKFQGVVLLYNKILRDFQIYNIPNWYFSNSLSTKSKGTIKKKLIWPKEQMITGNYYLIFAIKCTYEDFISRKEIGYKNHFIANEIKESKTTFSLIDDYEFVEKVNERLIYKKLESFLIDVESGTTKL